MDNIDESAQRLLERARQRRLQLEVDSGNISVDNIENVSPKKNAAPEPPKLNPLKSPAPEPPVPLRENSMGTDTPNGDDNTKVCEINARNCLQKARRSRFSELAAEVDNFEYTPLGARAKETFMTGPAKRLSLGETRPSVLFAPQQHVVPTVSPKRTPAPSRPEPSKEASPQRPFLSVASTSPARKFVSASPALSRVVEENRQVRFSEVNNEQSSIVEGSVESRMSFNTSRVCTFADGDETIEAEHGKTQQCREQKSVFDESELYGIHTLVQKKSSPSKNVSSSSLLGSPRPFLANSPKSQYSPNPQASSSPLPPSIVLEKSSAVSRAALAGSASPSNTKVPRSLFPTINIKEGVEMREIENWDGDDKQKKNTPLKVFEKEVLEDQKEMTPTKRAAIEAARASTISQQLEQRLKSTGYKVPTPRVLGGTASTTGVHAPMPTPQPIATPSVPVTLSQGVRWDPSHIEKKSTSKLSPFKESPPKATPKSKLAALRERWEVSSATGTPLHPDQGENELLSAAVKLSREVKTATYSRVNRVAVFQKPSPSVSTKKSPVKDVATETSPCSSPREKSARLEELEEAAAERDPVESDDSDNELETTNAAAAIDKMFAFMKSPATAPLAARESPSPQKEVLEEVDLEQEPDAPGRLVHSISMYRKRKFVPKPNLVFTPSNNAHGQSLTLGIVEEDEQGDQGEKARLEREILVQQERIAQASRALNYCRAQTEFRGSREEVDAQRALLIATETRRALVQHLEHLARGGKKEKKGPLGGLSISSVLLSLNRDFVNGQINMRDVMYYFIVLIKCGPVVQHTHMLTSEDAMNHKGLLEFNHYLQLQNLAPDFEATLEVYSLRTRHEVIPHEEKYKLRSGTLKKEKKEGTLAAIANFALGSSTPSQASTSFTYMQGAQILDPSFQLVGSLRLDIHSVDKKKFTLTDPRLPLDVSIAIKLKKYALEKGHICHRNFLSLYQRAADGLGAWTRFWCALEEGEMKLWRCPEDEEAGKKWAVYIDLQTCASSHVTPVPKEGTCPFPFSMTMDVWAPSATVDAQGRPKVEKLTLRLAADTKDDMQQWLHALNTTINNLMVWSSSNRNV